MKEGFLLHSVHQTFSLGGNVGDRGFHVPCLGFAGLIPRTFNPIFMLQTVKIRKPCFYPWQLPSQPKIKEDGPLQTRVLLERAIGKITRGVYAALSLRQTLHTCTSDPKIKFQIVMYAKFSYLSEKPPEAQN